MVEVLIMFALPLLFLRMRFKTMFLAGLAIWSLRYVFFAVAAPAGTAASGAAITTITATSNVLNGLIPMRLPIPRRRENLRAAAAKDQMIRDRPSSGRA